MNITDLKKYLHSQKEHPQNPTGNVLGLEARMHTDNMTFFSCTFLTQVRKRRWRCQTAWKHPCRSMHSLRHHPRSTGHGGCYTDIKQLSSRGTQVIFCMELFSMGFTKSELERSIVPVNDRESTDDDRERTPSRSGALRKTETFNRNDTETTCSFTSLWSSTKMIRRLSRCKHLWFWLYYGEE